MPCATSISINRDFIRVQKNGGYIYLTAMVQPSGACACVTWRSANNNIASVNPNTGYVFGMGAGTTTIYAETNDGSNLAASVVVHVYEPVLVQSIAMPANSVTVARGRRLLLQPTILPADATNKRLTWTSSQPNMVTVENGVVEGINTGSVIITATTQDGSNLSASMYVMVNIAVESIIVLFDPVSFAVGSCTYARKEISPTNATNKNVYWSSSNEAIASINPCSGLIHAHQSGRTTIRATSISNPDVYGEYILSVVVPRCISEIYLHDSRVILHIDPEHPSNTTYSISSSYWPLDISNPSISWSSDNTDVATVNGNGVITARGVGTATITATATDSGVFDTCKVMIFNQSQPYALITKHYDEMWYDTAPFIRFYNNMTANERSWYYIGEDISFSTPQNNQEELHREKLRARNNWNCYKTKDIEVGLLTPQAFSDDELRLLYSIDPHGVVAYVLEMAKYHGNTAREQIGYKDDIFEVLFGDKPNYYTQQNGGWVTKREEESINLDYDISESELLFGVHDIYAVESLCQLLYTFISLYLDIGTTLINIMTAGVAGPWPGIANTIKKAVWRRVLTPNQGHNILEDLQSFGVDIIMECIDEENLLSGIDAIYSVVSNYIGNIEELAALTTFDFSKINTEINYHAMVFNYSVFIKIGDDTPNLAGDTTYLLDEIRDNILLQQNPFA